MSCNKNTHLANDFASSQLIEMFYREDKIFAEAD